MFQAAERVNLVASQVIFFTAFVKKLLENPKLVEKFNLSETKINK